mmetsp:Transcript_70569/g.111599  ORF Transcript_70569/g.111599 Transcript_70569/m.111599 type:complete len:232 (-) Transcript_70569:345-1040(-)
MAVAVPGHAIAVIGRTPQLFLHPAVLPFCLRDVKALSQPLTQVEEHQPGEGEPPAHHGIPWSTKGPKGQPILEGTAVEVIWAETPVESFIQPPVHHEDHHGTSCQRKDEVQSRLAESIAEISTQSSSSYIKHSQPTTGMCNVASGMHHMNCKAICTICTICSKGALMHQMNCKSSCTCPYDITTCLREQRQKDACMTGKAQCQLQLCCCVSLWCCNIDHPVETKGKAHDEP